MERDVDFLVSRLSKIDGFGDTGDKLLTVVKAKKVDDDDPLDREAEGEIQKTSSNGGSGGNTTPQETGKAADEKGKTGGEAKKVAALNSK